MTADEWLEEFAAAIDDVAPSKQEIDQMLALAAEAAHSSERIAAPVACWIGARSGLPLTELVEIAARIKDA